MKMSYLKGKSCYLSGPIEFGSGPNWRIQPSKVLVEEFKINLFDPFGDPKQQWVGALNAAREQENYDEMVRIAKKFVRKDLSVVDEKNFIVAYLPRGVPTTGTVHEIIVKSEQKKPVLIVCPEGKKYVPYWYWGLGIHHSQMFGSWEDLYQYLRQVDEGKIDNPRWDYVYGKI